MTLSKAKRKAKRARRYARIMKYIKEIASHFNPLGVIVIGAVLTYLLWKW